MHDVAIIGTGPAGLSAALTLRLHERDLAWFGPAGMSPKVGRSERIANYPGVPLVTGADLNARFRDQAREMGLEPDERTVTSVTRLRDRFALLAADEMVEARCVLLACGVVAARGLDGEEGLLGHGVSYCATCDGFLYKGRRVAVLCGSARHEADVRYLAGIAGELWLDARYEGCGVEGPAVRRVPSRMVSVVDEGGRVRAVRLADGSELEVDALFCLRDAVAPATLVAGLAVEGPHVVTDRSCATNVEGLFAAGDVTGRPYQVAKAVGEGCVAAHAILGYLDRAGRPASPTARPAARPKEES